MHTTLCTSRNTPGNLRNIVYPLTFGIAYTKEPKADDDVDSGEDVVRNSSKFGPLSVS